MSHSLRLLSSTQGSSRRRSRSRRLAFLSGVGALFAAIALSAGMAEPTQASWTDGEATGASFQAGVVAPPTGVQCRFEQHSFRNLVIQWQPPGSAPGRIAPVGYRFDFVARGTLPQPSPASISLGQQTRSYRDFGQFFQDPRAPLIGTNTHRYRIHVTAVGPGSWQSESWVFEASVWRSTLGLGSGSSCTAVTRPSGAGGAVTLQEDPAEGLPEPQMIDEPVQDDFLIEESEVNNDAPPESTSPTENASDVAEEDATTVPSASPKTPSPDQTAPSDPGSPRSSTALPEAPPPEEPATEPTLKAPADPAAGSVDN